MFFCFFFVLILQEHCLLGKLYNIKPIVNQMDQLFDAFETVDIDWRKNGISNWGSRSTECGGYLWNAYDENENEHEQCIFSGCELSFMAQCSSIGDFSIVNQYFDDKCKSNNIWNKNRKYLHIANGSGVLPMLALFLHTDFFEKRFYIPNINDILHLNAILSPMQTLYALLNPSLLYEFAQYTEKKLMIPVLNGKNKFEFDLINNPRYDPLNRLKFLRKLCFSSKFCFAFFGLDANYDNKRQELYSKIRNLMINMYDNYDVFESEWKLNEYSKYKNDNDKKQSLHESFKTIIHSFMTVCEQYFYEKNRWVADETNFVYQVVKVEYKKTILNHIKHEHSSDHNGYDDDYDDDETIIPFVDLLPNDERGVKLLRFAMYDNDINGQPGLHQRYHQQERQPREWLGSVSYFDRNFVESDNGDGNNDNGDDYEYQKMIFDVAEDGMLGLLNKLWHLF